MTARILFLVVLVSAGCIVVFGQTVSLPSQDVLTCSPAPCVLAVTQVSQQGAVNADISVDPVDPKNLILGTVDFECGSMATYLSKDGGSTWALTNCMAVIITQRGRDVYYPAGQATAAFDLRGEAYSTGQYIDSEGVGFGLIVAQRSSDAMNWSPPGLALSLGFEELLYSWLAIDTSPQSPRANSLYVSTVALKEPTQRRSQVYITRSSSAGFRWTSAGVDPPSFILPVTCTRM